MHYRQGAVCSVLTVLFKEISCVVNYFTVFVFMIFAGDAGHLCTACLLLRYFTAVPLEDVRTLQQNRTSVLLDFQVLTAITLKLFVFLKVTP